MIKLTTKRYGLGWLDDRHELVNHDYLIQNNFDVYTTDERRREKAESVGQYEASAHMSIPQRKSKVTVVMGFDEYGNYKTSQINYGMGRFSKKTKQMMIKKLSEWLIDDGWAVEVMESEEQA